MAIVLTMVAKIRAARGKGYALAALLTEQAVAYRERREKEGLVVGAAEVEIFRSLSE